MSERRPLVDALKVQKPQPPVDPAVEERFVFSGKKTPVSETPHVRPPARIAVTYKLRADFAAALKRASLERQLSETTPNTLQEILEQALEPWLRNHGYIA
jgi:hypothetical protein